MKISNFKLKIKSHFLIIIFLIFYLFIISFKLISHSTPFYDWDESINAQVAKEMIENKSLVPLWQGKYWLDKPPLPFLFFGTVMKLIPFVQPEISLRLTSLFLSLIALLFVYLVFLKTSNRLMATLTVIITAFTPIFLQRSQILNLDVFLLIGWLGYLLFAQNFWLSLFFLTVGVLTKSLLGFYPAVIMLGFYLYKLIRKPPRLRSEADLPIVALAKMEEPRRLIKRLIKMIFIQIVILSIWYLAMFTSFGKDFWQQHIIETHFRRVTASLESHFGQRTYYIDLMIQQLGLFFLTGLLGLALVILERLKGAIESPKKILSSLQKSSLLQDDKLLYSLFLFPWFVFLNLTKTKIFWYLYPTIPQFAFLSVYPLTLFVRHSGVTERSEGTIESIKKMLSLRSSMTIKLYYLLSLFIALYIFQQNFIKTNFFTTFYSQPEDYYRLALYAKDHCDSLTVFVGKETRKATKTLESLGLTITSTKQWGDHPSIVYYFGQKVNFIYDRNLLTKRSSSFSKNDCLVVRKDDLDLNLDYKKYKQVKNFDSYYLFKR